MSKRITTTLTERQLRVMGLALVKCDVLSDIGVLKKPWCNNHSDYETLRILEKLDALDLKMSDKPEPHP
jgi:hypothetical protein